MGSLFGELGVIGMRGCEGFVEQVDSYLREWRRHGDEETYLITADCPRFGSGEAKAIVHESMRGHDLYIVTDIFNHYVEYKMYGKNVPMSPDDHYQDLKRIIAAVGGKARRISVIMPMLYEGRQHKRTTRESLDCALALQELVNMGVSNIITFDAHDPRVSNSIPLSGFDDVRPTYQMLKALCKKYPDISLSKEDIMVISPDEGAMSRSMYYASVMGIDLGMFYKRRNYSIVVNGKNPIEAHEYLGKDIRDKDVIVVDDMLSSGESVLDVCLQLKEKGAKRIFLFLTFALFSNGYDAIEKAYNEGLFTQIFSTNLVYAPDELLKKEWFTQVNMCKYVAYLIDTLNHDESISTLLNPVKRIHNLLEKQAAKVAEKSDTQLPLV
ncbi:MAG: ribose-phosphate pyrophosphokinase [Clostridia bacterium]|nr:ribose-phosphate pyrophosphokinase [Clostridia bacterium]